MFISLRRAQILVAICLFAQCLLTNAGAEDSASSLFALQDSLKRRDFKTIYSKLEILSDRSAKDPQAEEELFAVLSVLGEIGRSNEPTLDEFVRLMPDKGFALLTRSFYRIQESWFARGYGSANRVRFEGEMDAAASLLAGYADMESALVKNPSLAMAHVAAIEILGLTPALAKPGQALTKEEHFRKLLQLNPLSFVGRWRYIRFLQPRWGGSYEQMQTVIDESKSAAVNNPKLNSLPGLIIADQANTLVMTKNYDNALALIFPKVSDYSTIPELFTVLGEAYYRRNDNANALKYFSSARALRPYYDMYIGQTARAKFHSSNLSGMKEDLEFLKRNIPDSGEISTLEKLLSGNEAADIGLKAQSLANGGRIQEGLELADKAIAQDPGNGALFYIRANMYLKQNRISDAKADLLKSIQLKPDYFASVKLIDQLLAQEGKFDEIIQYWTNYLGKVPKDGRALLERGGAYHHAHKDDLAKKDIAEACALGSAEACQLGTRLGIQK